MTANDKLQRIIETQRLASQLMSEFGLIEDGWQFRISNTKTFLGRCFYGRKVIEFSKHYLEESWDQIEDTMRHEIAHAIAYTKYGEDGKGHGHLWRRTAIECGANPMRNAEDVRYSGDFNYIVTCQNDDCPKPWKHGKHRIKQAYYRYHCKYCLGPITVVDLKTGDITFTTPSKDWVHA